MLIRKLRSLIAIMAGTLLMGGCIDDRCGAVVCANEGVCVDGKCTCPVGFEGAICETAWYQKFEGNWKVNQAFIKDTTETVFKYDVGITGARDSFLLTGLSDTLQGVICKRQSLYAFTIKPNQVLRADSSIIIKSGEGILQGNTIKGLYSFQHHDTIISARFTLSR